MNRLYLIICKMLLSFLSFSMTPTVPENVLLINDISEFESFQLEREDLWAVMIFYNKEEKSSLIKNIETKKFKSQISTLKNPPEGLFLIGYSEDEKEEDLTTFFSENKSLFEICNVTLYNQTSYCNKDLINKKQAINYLLSLHAKEEYSTSLLWFNQPKGLNLAIFEHVEKRNSLKQSKKNSGYKNLFWFALEHNPKMLPFLTENNARGINKIVENETPIIYCIKKRRNNDMLILINHKGISYSYLDGEHQNILHHAIQSGYENIIYTIIQDPNNKYLIDQEDVNVTTPLLMAAVKGNETTDKTESICFQKICQALFKKGSNPTLWSPLPEKILNYHVIPNCDNDNKPHRMVRMRDWAISSYNDNFMPKPTPKLKRDCKSLFRIIIIKKSEDKLFTDWVLINNGKDVEEFKNSNIFLDDNTFMLSNKGDKLCIETHEFYMWANSTISPDEFIIFLHTLENNKSYENVSKKINRTKFILFKKGK